MAVTKKQLEAKKKGRSRGWWSDARIGKKNDGRKCGLTDEDKIEIKRLADEGMAVRAIARQYEDKCSRRTIMFLLNPAEKKRVAEAFKERRKDGRYYDRDKQREYMRKYRKKLKALTEKQNG